MKVDLISVIIPARNVEKTLEQAVESIANQTYSNLEIIIVDDNSTDHTMNVARKMVSKHRHVSYHLLTEEDPYRFNKNGRNVNAGWSARNFGFTKANGAWITFQDADDVSLLNRIEIQYKLAKEYDSSHICIDWQKYEDSLNDKLFDLEKFSKDTEDNMIGPEEIYTISQRSKGLLPKIIGSLHEYIPFRVKQMLIINRLFFGNLDAYPGAGNSPLFKKEIVDKVVFRPYTQRVWPSFVGRGADRDFNFQVAETFKNSHVFLAPMYLWRQDLQNKSYSNPKKYTHEI